MQTLPRDDNNKLVSWAWPGGYPIFYLDQDNSVLCPKCAREHETNGFDFDVITAADINYEDTFLTCDECNDHIQSAYGDDDA